ncbi:hypothetical protein [Paenibacillus apiarius]
MDRYCTESASLLLYQVFSSKMKWLGQMRGDGRHGSGLLDCIDDLRSWL